MKLKVWDTNGNFLGGVLTEGGIARCSDDAHEMLRSAVNELQKNGVYTYYEDRKLHERQYTILRVPARSESPLYPLAVRDALMARGLCVDIDTPETDRYIREKLGSFPDSEERKDLLSRLDSMRILEKSFLRKELEAFGAARS